MQAKATSPMATATNRVSTWVVVGGHLHAKATKQPSPMAIPTQATKQSSPLCTLCFQRACCGRMYWLSGPLTSRARHFPPRKHAAHSQLQEPERYKQLLQDPEVQPLVKSILKYQKPLGWLYIFCENRGDFQRDDNGSSYPNIDSLEYIESHWKTLGFID